MEQSYTETSQLRVAIVKIIAVVDNCNKISLKVQEFPFTPVAKERLCKMPVVST
jgi:hypothetical protein